MTRKGHRTGSPRPARTGREAGILGRSWPFLGLAFLLYKMEINSLLSLACLLPCNEPVQHHKTGDTKTTTRSLPFNLIITYRVSHLPSSQVAPVTVSGSIQVDAGCTWLVTPLLQCPPHPASCLHGFVSVQALPLQVRPLSPVTVSGAHHPN